MDKCNLCPRKCNVDRGAGERGYCGMPCLPRVARASLHMWEEPCISGERGSGTIFFSGCSLKCVYCQNYKISHENYGKDISVHRLTEIIRELEEKGAHNINFVSPTHYSHIIKEVLTKYRPSVPVIYNCSGYERVETLRSLEGLIDIYLTDLKYFDGDVSKKYSGAEDYFQYAQKAVLEMQRQVGKNIFDEKGMMQKGLIIRHLVLPGNLLQTEKILSWIRNNLPEDTMLSLMSQYTPCGEADKFKELSGKLTESEYNKALDYLYLSNIENGYVQEISSSDEMYIPPFDSEGV